MWLVLDLETIPDPQVPALKPTPDRPDPCPPAPCHQIVEAGVLRIERDYTPAKLAALSDESQDERSIVERLTSILNSGKYCVVTFNGRRFDLPVLAARAMRHGLPFPWYYASRYGARYRYSDEWHLDLSDYLSDHGSAPFTSMDRWAKMIGLPGKTDFTGKSVAALEQEGRHPEVRTYCLSDVVQESALFYRLMMLRGGAPKNPLDVERATLSLAKLLELGRDAGVSLEVDRDRFYPSFQPLNWSV